MGGLGGVEEGEGDVLVGAGGAVPDEDGGEGLFFLVGEGLGAVEDGPVGGEVGAFACLGIEIELNDLMEGLEVSDDAIENGTPVAGTIIDGKLTKDGGREGQDDFAVNVQFLGDLESEEVGAASGGADQSLRLMLFKEGADFFVNGRDVLRREAGS